MDSPANWAIAGVFGALLGGLACETAGPSSVASQEKAATRPLSSRDASVTEASPGAAARRDAASAPSEALSPATLSPQVEDVPVALTSQELRITCKTPLQTIYSPNQWVGIRCLDWTQLAGLDDWDSATPLPAGDAGSAEPWLDACPAALVADTLPPQEPGCVFAALCPGALSGSEQGCCYEVAYFCGD